MFSHIYTAFKTEISFQVLKQFLRMRMSEMKNQSSQCYNANSEVWGNIINRVKAI